jgi:hypothetical protein
VVEPPIHGGRVRGAEQQHAHGRGAQRDGTGRVDR